MATLLPTTNHQATNVFYSNGFTLKKILFNFKEEHVAELIFEFSAYTKMNKNVSTKEPTKTASLPRPDASLKRNKSVIEARNKDTVLNPYSEFFSKLDLKSTGDAKHH